MATLTNGTQQITVPDDVADSYVSRGWVRPGVPALAEPAPRKKPRKKFSERKAEVLAAIDPAEVSDPDLT